MPRNVTPKPLSKLLATLNGVARSIEADGVWSPLKSDAVRSKLNEAMSLILEEETRRVRDGGQKETG